MKSAGRIFAVLALFAVVSATASDALHERQDASGDADALAIRAIRARSNDAIAERDLDALAETWLADVQVVASSGEVLSGSDAVLAVFERVFRDPEFVTYVRSPRRVEIGVTGDEAAERGDWTGTWQRADGAMTLSGTYLAQWRRAASGWRIRAELFVALECAGSQECPSR